MTSTYTPPNLPTYLANGFDLNPVVGVPTDDEVKTIHAVIRAVETSSQIPAWSDPDLSMKLSQHLFNVQMARYRDKYPISIFPSNHTYTPPALPSHINIPLESVTGAPSDEEVKQVHLALRASEGLTNVPGLYDPGLSMNLSQHLFDMQFARYLQHTTEGHYTTPDALPNVEYRPEPRAQGVRAPVDPAPDTKPLATQEADRTDVGVATLSQDIRGVIERLRVNQVLSGQRLAGMQAALENNTRIMVKLHNHSARASNCSDIHGGYHHIINENGDAPTTCYSHFNTHSHTYNYWSNAPEDAVARSLLFYNVRVDLVEQGDTLALKPDSIHEARAILGVLMHAGVV
ncbi:hypothetical protein BDV93DRAFT_251361 [Ceratobasidium sp. AG-I]|nr:hypothetical protein BDV93DRAFT_251361 [Ceratobasidium sp. AG-I]